MAQNFRETAHLNTDKDAYNDNWDRIFGKKDKEPNTEGINLIRTELHIFDNSTEYAEFIRESEIAKKDMEARGFTKFSITTDRNDLSDNYKVMLVGRK